MWRANSAEVRFEPLAFPKESGTPAIPECPIWVRRCLATNQVSDLGSSLDVADVLNLSADQPPEHALQLGQAWRPITSECPMVLLALVDSDNSEPITEFAIADPLDRLEHAQVAWGKHASGRGPDPRGPRRYERLAAPPLQISNSHHASHSLPLRVPAVI